MAAWDKIPAAPPKKFEAPKPIVYHSLAEAEAGEKKVRERVTAAEARMVKWNERAASVGPGVTVKLYGQEYEDYRNDINEYESAVRESNESLAAMRPFLK